jgi:acetyltransferase-like isoleucine patch superfamily enzyme
MIKGILRKIYYHHTFQNIVGSIYPILMDIYRLKQLNNYRKKYDIHSSVRLGEHNILYGNGKIIIGEGSYIGRHASILAYDGCEVRIGHFCSISHYLAIYTVNTIANQDFSKQRDLEKGNVTIGDYTWIGYRVYINQGVNIGRNCVIGAHSVVADNIPDYSVAVGIPAKVVRQITPTSPKE